ncbi:MAG: immune inhibitor A [Anaerolineaceae bacterium]|nr:immune inhibitor A [Anaerolineaceae bacterium]
MTLARRLLFACLAALLTGVASVAAQESAMRDPLQLAQRLGDYQGETLLTPLTPLYRVGQREDFYVSRNDAAAPERISATLAAATPLTYVWVEDGLEYNAANMAATFEDLQFLALTQRMRGVHGEATLLPGMGPVYEQYSLLPLPDVDDDPHLFLLFADGTGLEPAAINQADLLPTALAPGRSSNQRELLLLDAPALGNVPLSSPAWLTLATAAHFEFLSQTHAPQQSLWLRRAQAHYVAARLLGLQPVLDTEAQTWLAARAVPLTRAAGLNQPEVSSGQALFLEYLLQRHGIRLLQELFLQPEPGLEALDNALAELELTDALTGRTLSGLDLFADFTVAVAADLFPPGPLLDGRYTLLLPDLPEGELPNGIVLENRLNAAVQEIPLDQFATHYFYIYNDRPASFRLQFHGADESALLSLPAEDDPGNLFYWTGQGSNRDHTMTRRIDLRGVEQATLHFDSWHQLAEQRSYVYVAVSDDDGGSWQILDGGHDAGNRHGLAYGPGLTGVSNPEPLRPFPYIGVMLDGDGQTITEIVAEGPARDSDLRPGDVIVGLDGADWAEGDGIFPMLDRQEPGDTVDLSIRRGDERLVIPLTLVVHPARHRPRPPLWLPQEFDLDAWAGQEILLRFEYVTPPDVLDEGLALDNLRIPETGFHDDAGDETGWTLLGWQRRDNFVPQRFLLQYISSGHSTGPPRVRRLIGPQDMSNRAEHNFRIQPDELIVFAVSAINEQTQQPAFYDLQLQTLDAGV